MFKKIYFLTERICSRNIYPVLYYLFLPIGLKFRREVRLSMNRPVSIDKIMSSFSKRNHLFEKDIFQLIHFIKSRQRIGLFRLNRLSKNNILYALIKSMSEKNILFVEKIYENYFSEVFDLRCERFMVVINNRNHDYQNAMDILNFFPSNEWKNARQKDVTSGLTKSLSSIKKAPIGWQPNIHSSFLEKEGINFSHPISKDTEKSNFVIIGKIKNFEELEYNSALCCFRFKNKDSQIINLSQGEVKAMGLSYSEAVKSYKYLKTDSNGFFMVDFIPPEDCKLVEVSFKTWTAVDGSVVLDNRLYIFHYDHDDWLKSMNKLSERMSEWFDDKEWPKFITNFYENQIINRLEVVDVDHMSSEILSLKIGINNDFLIKKLLYFTEVYNITIQPHKITLQVLNELLDSKPINVQNLEVIRLLMRNRATLHNREAVLFTLRIVQIELANSEDSNLGELTLYCSKLNTYLGNISESLSVMQMNKKRLQEIDSKGFMKSYIRRMKVLEQNFNLLDNQFIFQDFNSRKYMPKNGIIYLLHNSLPYHNGGYACRSHGLLNGLIELGMNMYPMTRLCYPWDMNGFRELEFADYNYVDSIKYSHSLVIFDGYSTTTPVDYINRYARQVIEKAQENKVSIIHAASNHRNGLASILAAKNLNIPCIYEVRGFWEITRVSREPEWAETDQYRLEEKLETTACKLADQVLTLNMAMKRELIRRGVEENKIEIIPNGVDCERFTPLMKDQDLLDDLNLNNKFIIGYIGSIVQYEGLDILIQAVNLLHYENPDLHILIVGDGVDLDRLENMVREFELEERFTFTGRVPHETVERYHSIIDVAVFPRTSSLVTELVTPLKPFEAMAMGKCIICSDVAALSEFIIEGENGFTFTKDDPSSLAKVILDSRASGSYLKIGIEARKWVEKERDWKAISNKLKSIYDGVLSDKSLNSLGIMGDNNSVNSSILQGAYMSERAIRLSDIRLITTQAKKRYNEFKSEGFTVRKDIPPWNMNANELDFEEDPFNDRNWRFQINSLRPIDPALTLSGFSNNESFKYALGLMMKWIDCDNRYDNYSGMRWYDMAAGLRASRLAFIIQNSERHGYSESIIKKLKDSASKHIEIMTNPDFTKENNHGLFVIHGLMALCYACPELSKQNEVRESCNARMEELIHSQFDEEGIHKENSPEYHFFIQDVVKGFIETGWYSFKNLYSKIKNIDLANCWLIWPNKFIIPVGDSSGQKLVKDNLLMNSMNKLDDISNVSFRFGGEKYLFKHFTKSGYVIVRSSFSISEKTASMLFCLSAFQSKIHRQMDDLSFQLFENGEEIFVDPGKYSYNHEDPVRKMVISTMAHNTLEIDAENYSNHSSAKYDSALTGQTEYEWGIALEFGRFWDKFATRHHRILLYRPKEFLIVIDILKANEKREFRQWFHLNENFELKPQEIEMTDRYIFENDNQLLRTQFLCSIDNQVSIYNGNTNPMIGWRSIGYNNSVPIISLNQMASGKECVLATGFSLTGGDIDLKLDFENDVVEISGKINDIDLDFKKSVFPK